MRLIRTKNEKSHEENKNNSVLSLLLAVAMFLACKKNQILVGKFEVKNESGQELVLHNTVTCEKLFFGSGQSKMISTHLAIDSFSIEAPAGELRNFTFEQAGDQKYTIIAYLNLLEYRISGLDTKAANISFLDNRGIRIEMASVDLPYELSYKKF